jgi:phosphoglycerate kinase
LINEIEKDPFIKLNSQNLVSCDFLTTTYPSIVDKKASMHLGGNRFKLMIWYDNEWSYSAQVIRLLETMYDFNNKSFCTNKYKYFINNYNFNDKRVILRVDWNIPTKNFVIEDDYRIVSSLPTIKKILNDKPKRLVIISHFGRPKGKTDKYSWKHYLEEIQKYFDKPIIFLEDGLSEATLDKINDDGSVYLLENIRFHDIETNYVDSPEDALERDIIQKLGDFYVNDAFGCMHRNHLSICGVSTPQKAFGYLVNREIEALKIITENNDNKKILAIIGGAKMDDKLPLVEQLSMKMNDIYIAGGNINSILKNDMEEYIEKISKNKAKIHFMKDGFSSSSLDGEAVYSKSDGLKEDHYFYDIGMESMVELSKLIQQNDIIFWNGTLGVVENHLYKLGSETLVNFLIMSGKKIVVGGGDTASFVNKFEHNFDHILTGGGASIEYISNGSLVGIDFFRID